MARITCFFATTIDHELDRKLSALGMSNRAGVLRLLCRIAFKTTTGWTKPFPAIIDTGAHTSLIPLNIWSLTDAQILADHYVKGLVPKPECKIDVKVGTVTGVLLDRQNSSKEYRFLSFLATTNDVPLILGFKELLSKLRLYIDPQTSTAWLEEP
jgi:hypothetical protein